MSDNAVVKRRIRTNEVFGPSCSWGTGATSAEVCFEVGLDFNDIEGASGLGTHSVR